MIFYKKRSFGDLFTDSLQFFKTYGKNYFKNYFAINGALLILLLIISYIGFKDFAGQLFMSNTSGQAYYFEKYFEQNTSMLVSIGILMMFVFILITLISQIFPVVYLSMAAKTNRNDFSVNELYLLIKSKIGRAIKLFLLSLMFLPVLFIAFGIVFFLSLFLIGIPLLMMLIPTTLGLYYLLYYDYLSTNNGFFESLSNAFGNLFSKNFWKYTGTIFIILLIVQIVSSVFNILFMLISTGSIFLSPNTSGEGFAGFAVLLLIVNALNMLMSYVMMNWLNVSIGFMYFDSREDLHRKVYFEEIDSIGKNV